MDWRAFHDFTNHHPNRPGGHVADPSRPRPLDPARMPQPFKEYLGEATSVELVDHRKEWLAGQSSHRRGFDLEELSRLLILGAGAKRLRRMRDRYFRTYASAGALHPNELFVAAASIDGLNAGLYHFHPRDKKLIRLGEGDPRHQLVEATEDDSLLDHPVILAVSGIPWRTAWKYGPRGYRHLWWDAGMIIANLMALADSAGLPSRVLAHFLDERVNHLIGADGQTEMALALVGIGEGTPSSEPQYSPLNLRAAPISSNSFEFPEITAVHRETALSSTDDFRKEAARAGAGEPIDEIDKVIWKRGSTRRFDPTASITQRVLEDVLAYASAPIPCDWTTTTNELFVIANAVDGVEPGAYHWKDQKLQRISRDPGAREAAHFLSLVQALGSDAAAVIFPMADLGSAVETAGPRGYRTAQLEGPIMSGRLYLAAYAAGYGATGLTFYDEEVSKYFQTSREPTLEVAIGTPNY
ncbi:MAG: SagB family peptide dehydrogenase [Actinobacteria bacterium]|nr:SagB family peptide dehydrogenase [Actinomycetota bacterium]